MVSLLAASDYGNYMDFIIGVIFPYFFLSASHNDPLLFASNGVLFPTEL